MKLPSVVFLPVSFLLGTVAARTTQTDVSKPSQGSVNHGGKIKVHEICNWGVAKVEVSLLTQQFDRIQQKDPWIKLNTAPVCFDEKGDQLGKFSIPSGGRLLAFKLVHLYGYVQCDKTKVYHWSYWGCGAHSNLSDYVDIAITTSTNDVLLPPSQ